MICLPTYAREFPVTPWLAASAFDLLAERGELVFGGPALAFPHRMPCCALIRSNCPLTNFEVSICSLIGYISFGGDLRKFGGIFSTSFLASKTAYLAICSALNSYWRVPFDAEPASLEFSHASARFRASGSAHSPAGGSPQCSVQLPLLVVQAGRSSRTWGRRAALGVRRCHSCLCTSFRISFSISTNSVLQSISFGWEGSVLDNVRQSKCARDTFSVTD